MSERILLLGATGGAGVALLKQLAASNAAVIAWSRHGKGAGPSPVHGLAIDAAAPGTRASDTCVEWRTGDLFVDALPVATRILSAGPIDGLVSALQRSPDCAPRVIVALSSSSALFKRDSCSVDERAIVHRLLTSEAVLAQWATERGARCIILRSTLIYGGHNAAHFDAIEAAARGFGRVALPRSARGLRMPIHVDDLAATMLKSLHSSDADGLYYVGGGETLAYDLMVERVLEARGLRQRVHLIPDFAYRSMLRVANYAGRMQGLTHAMVLRMRENLVVDDSAARRELGHAPGLFRP